MTAPLRKAHLRIWLFVTVALAAVIAASLISRPDPAVNGFRWEELR
ncbi:MAG: hypothetical protein IT161_12705 [Bryobacterales bacterium]|nr:hypothetical protein [Bryobacterales bacterium]